MLTKKLSEIHFHPDLIRKVHDFSGGFRLSPPLIDNVTIVRVREVVVFTADSLMLIHRRKNAGQPQGEDDALWQSHRIIFDVDSELLNPILNLEFDTVTVWQFTSMRCRTADFFVHHFLKSEADISFSVL
jgi:hypothetical protein